MAVYPVDETRRPAWLAEENLRAAERFARLLNAPQPLFSEKEVHEFAADSGLNAEEAFPLMMADKKNTNARITFILPHAKDGFKLVQDITPDELQAAIDAV